MTQSQYCSRSQAAQKGSPFSHSPTEQPVACGQPLWASVSPLVPAQFLQFLLLAQKQCGKRGGWKTPLGWSPYWVLSVSTWEGTLVTVVLAKECGADMRDASRGRWESALTLGWDNTDSCSPPSPRGSWRLSLQRRPIHLPSCLTSSFSTGVPGITSQIKCLSPKPCLCPPKLAAARRGEEELSN